MKKALVAGLFASLFIVACSKPHPLEDAMGGMKGAFIDLKKAETLEDKKQILARFEEKLSIAQQQKVKPEDQKTFDEGLEKLMIEVKALRLQLESGNIENIQPQLKKLKDIQKEYHELLNVN